MRASPVWLRSSFLPLMIGLVLALVWSGSSHTSFESVLAAPPPELRLPFVGCANWYTYHGHEVSGGSDDDARDITPKSGCQGGSAPWDQTIRAAARGKVIYRQWGGGYGWAIVLDHDPINGIRYQTVYAHMCCDTTSPTPNGHSFQVNLGDSPNQGDPLGKMGNSGTKTTGAHLHFEIRRGSLEGRPFTGEVINPDGMPYRSSSIYCDDNPGGQCKPGGEAEGPPLSGNGTADKLPPPILNAPQNGAQFQQGQSISFSWSPVSGASRYRFESWRDGGGLGTQGVEVNGTSYSFTPASPGTWLWQVATINGSNVRGDWPTARQFTVNTQPQAVSCPPSADQIALYEHPYFNQNATGQCKVFGVGDYPGPVAFSPFPDNYASSLRVGANVKVELCSEESYRSGCLWFVADSDDLGATAVGDDAVSSFRVVPRGSTGTLPEPGTWALHYFNNFTLTPDGPYEGRCRQQDIMVSPFIFVDWGDQSPMQDPACNADFSARIASSGPCFQKGRYTFYLFGDDKARLKIGQDIVVNQWDDPRNPVAVKDMEAGCQGITVEFADFAGLGWVAAWWEGPGLPALPREQPAPGMWWAEYWGNRYPTTNAPVQVNEPSTGIADPFLKKAWGNSGPGYGLPEDRFSARFRRTVAFECGLYRFNLPGVDDGARLFIDGVKHFERWPGSGGFVDVPVAGGDRQIVVDYYENTGGANLELSWTRLPEVPALCANPVPVISGLIPSSVQAGNPAFTLTVEGADFVNGAAVRWNGSDRPTRFLSTTRLAADLTAADVASAGSASVVVVNPAPGGGSSNAQTFTIAPAPARRLTFSTQPGGGEAGARFSPQPRVTALDDNGSVAAGFNGPITVVIKAGTGAAGAILTGTTTVTAAGGIAPFADLATDKAGANYILVASSSGLTGAESAPFSITDSGPVITLLSPSSVTAGGSDFVLFVSGRNFASTSKVRWNGADRTTYLGNGQVFAEITATDILAPGTAAITVVNADGRVSNAQTFTIDNPAPPAAPANLRVTAVTSNSVSLAWDDKASNETGFRLFRNGSLLVTVGLNGGSQSPTYQDTGVSCGVTYSYQIRAFNNAGESTSSNSVATTTASCPATKLAFNVQPAGAAAGTAFTTQPKVVVRDTGGNVVPSYTGPVTLAIKSGTGATGAVLRGTTTVNAVSGVATFSGLSIDKTGSGYVLSATSPGLTSADSAPFSVQAPPNLVKNPGFENGTYSAAGNPANWTRDAWIPANTTFTWDTAQRRSGTKSVKIASTVANDARWMQTIAVQPNTDYRLSGWIKTDNVAHSQEVVDAGANLCLDGTWTRSAGVYGTSGWTYVSLSFNSGSSTQVTIAARLGYWAGTTMGTAWFDDIRLEATGSAMQYNPSGTAPRLALDAGTEGESGVVLSAYLASGARVFGRKRPRVI